MQGLEDIVLIYSFGECNFAIREDGLLYGWGRNQLGQLGDGTQEPRLDPVPILDNVVSVSAFYNSSVHAGRPVTTLAVRTDGSIWVWGYNIGKWTGDPDITSSLVPIPSIMSITGDLAQPVEAVEALVVTEEMMAKVPLPIAASDRVLEIGDFNAQTISTGGDSYNLLRLVLTDGGVPLMSRINAANREFELIDWLGSHAHWWGFGSDVYYVDEPTDGPFLGIAHGNSHGLVISEDNRLLAWSPNPHAGGHHNRHGQLGQGDNQRHRGQVHSYINILGTSAIDIDTFIV